MAKTQDPVHVVEGEVLALQNQEAELAQLTAVLSKNEQFANFMRLAKAVETKRKEVRENIAKVLVPAYERKEVEKRTEGDWGYVTITEEDDFDIDEEQLPKTYYKKVINKALIKSDYQLKGKAPKGCTPKKKYGIRLEVKAKEA